MLSTEKNIMHGILFQSDQTQKISRIFLYFIVLSAIIHLAIDITTEADSFSLVTQFATLLLFGSVSIYDYFYPSNNTRIFFLVTIGTIHLSTRYYSYKQVVAPTLMWFPLIPPLLIFFIHSKKSHLISHLITLIVMSIAIIHKADFEPTFNIDSFNAMEMNALIGFITVNYILTFFFKKIDQSKDEYAELIKNRIDSEAHIAKLSSIGEMSGALAHEINNPLTIIRGSADILKIKLNKRQVDGLAEYNAQLDKIVSVTENISFLMKNVLSISSKEEQNSYSIESFLESLQIAESIVGNKLKLNDIELRYNSDEVNKFAYLAKEVVAQVLINLFSNAAYAIKDLDQRWIEIKADEDDRSIYIFVIDSGKGIKSETVEKMFEPFYTTKPKGEGTGFGLSLSSQMLAKFGSSISYFNYNGNTSFKITLNKNEVSENQNE